MTFTRPTEGAMPEPLGVSGAETVVCVGPWDKSIVQLDGEGLMLREQLAAWITEYYGERCPEFEPTCLVCEAWHAYDVLFATVLDSCKDRESE